MWITGFDVPSCSTMYLDKPMKNHTLMQTIARANRVFPNKNNGLIVDYVGIFRNLEKALAVYGKPEEGGMDSPVKNKEEIKLELEECMKEIITFLSPLNIDLDLIRSCKDIPQRLGMFGQARDTLVRDDQTRKDYLKQAEALRRIYKAYLPDPVGSKMAERAYLVRKLSKAIRSLNPDIDINEVLEKVEDLLDRSIEGYEIKDTTEDNLYDLSMIDFDVLKKRFEKGDKKKTEVEILKNEVKRTIVRMSKVNKIRMNYLDKLNDMIAEYNQGAKSVQEIFDMLLELAKQLKQEEKRYIKEELNNEKELAIFDLLTKPEPELNEKEIKSVKSVARSLYNKLAEGLLVLDWRNKQETKSRVKVAIKKELDIGLPEVYDTKIYEKKCSAVYDYVWETM